jgi:Uncharacterized conserved protein
MKQSDEAIAEERPTEQEGDAMSEQTCSTSSDEEWPVSWVVKRLEAEIHEFTARLNKLEARMEKLEQEQEEISLVAFCKGLALLDYRLVARPKKLSGFSIRTEADFNRATRLTTALIDIVGDDENHPLADVLDCVADQVEAYEGEHYPTKDAQGES